MHLLLFGLSCLLLSALPLVFSKDCYFCEITTSTKCPATLMSCAEEEDCFVGEGAALGVSMIKNKGCTRSINCGKEQAVKYMGVVYSLVTNCCQGDLCNAAPWPLASSIFLQLGLVSMVILGLL